MEQPNPPLVIRIDRRFRGPPESGNGGYVAGMLATALGGSGVEVTLRAPPPLERDLMVSISGGSAELRDADKLIATATRAIFDLAVPLVPGITEAREAATQFVGFERHAFPGCFVCGPERAAGDGLRIFPGAIDEGAAMVAGIWHPDPSLGRDGLVAIEHVWAALDCAGYFAVQEAAGVAVLGRIAVEITAVPSIGEDYVVSGWGLASEGRKHRVGTAISDRDGGVMAKAAATWVTIG